jgi:hypothetical protein
MKTLVVDFDDDLYNELQEIRKKHLGGTINKFFIDLITAGTRTPEEKQAQAKEIEATYQESQKARLEAEERRYGKVPEIKPRTDGKILQFTQMEARKHEKGN